jgi:dihydroxyacid dehydratase/phosphogluconate dehydratase
MTHPVITDVTARIAERSLEQRRAYLSRLAAAAESGPARGRLACANLAHGFAASDTRDKSALRRMVKPNVAIVSSYNDMLSAHKPFESYPARLKQAVLEAGGMACVINSLLDAGLMQDDVRTVAGDGLRRYTAEPQLDGEGLRWVDGARDSLDTTVLRTADEPFAHRHEILSRRSRGRRAVFAHDPRARSLRPVLPDGGDHSDECGGISQDAQRWVRGWQLAHAGRCRRTRRLAPDLQPGRRRR